MIIIFSHIMPCVYVVNSFTDIDECALDSRVCDENANCTDTDGSFQCSCVDGYTGNGTHCEGELNYIITHIGELWRGL